MLKRKEYHRKCNQDWILTEFPGIHDILVYLQNKQSGNYSTFPRPRVLPKCPVISGPICTLYKNSRFCQPTYSFNPCYPPFDRCSRTVPDEAYLYTDQYLPGRSYRWDCLKPMLGRLLYRRCRPRCFRGWTPYHRTTLYTGTGGSDSPYRHRYYRRPDCHEPGSCGEYPQLFRRYPDQRSQLINHIFYGNPPVKVRTVA